jgi:pimeloyl-ACP methyl ester carboxylesterase
VIFLLTPLVILATAILYQNISAARDRRRFPPLGRIVDVDGTRLHVYEQGQGSPVVILESGIGASSLSWANVQPGIAAFTRVISYDRAGLGWSACPRVPRSVPAMVDELGSLLARVNAAPPYVLVGHSFGGLLVRAYAGLYPREVSGLVLVDPVSIAAWKNCSESDLQRLRLGARLAKRGAWLARVGVVRAALAALVAGGRWFPKLAARSAGRRGTAAMTNLVGEVRKLPPALWPLVRSHWSDPKCFRSLAEYLNCLPESAQFVAQMPALKRIPVMILSASNATGKELEERDRWVRESGVGKHIAIRDAGHWLHLETPQVVVGAVQEVIRLAAQNEKPLGSDQATEG